MAYWKRFLFDEEGAELIQFALVIAIVAVLAIAIQGVVSSAEGKVNDAKNLIDGINIGGSGSGSGKSEESLAAKLQLARLFGVTRYMMI